MRKFQPEECARIYNDAIDTFGIPTQLTVAIEELSELQKELCKVIRGFASPAAIAEEMADVHIIMEQLHLIFDNTECVEHYMDSKIKRLMERTDDAKSAG